MSSTGSSRTTTPFSSSPSTAPTTPLSFEQDSDTSNVKDTAFSRWRPSYHLMPARGWMNDPCAPGYDPKTGLYHISFQWNPNGCDWGNISWGSATSPDMLSWNVQNEPSLVPDMPYDAKGVFTGCFVNARDGSLTYAYTSVSALPIHHSLPHLQGSEQLSLAKSFDKGRTWTKDARNPVLPSEPEGLVVTGWRDPFVAPWPRISQFLKRDGEHTLFGIISGGIRDVTPTTFLYAIDANDLSRWQFIGPLVNFGLNARPSKWSGDLGTNWEVSNFMTLRDEEDRTVERDFLVMGTEGCRPTAPVATIGPSRPHRHQLWMSGHLRSREESQTYGPVDMSYDFGGHLDHGCFYAANSFYDQQSQSQAVWGFWITEDDLCDGLRHAQGWSGLLSMPRELRMQTLENVVRASASTLEEITSIEQEADAYGSWTVRTLASQPLQRLVDRLRAGPNVEVTRLGRSGLTLSGHGAAFAPKAMRTTCWNLECCFELSPYCRQVGLSIGHSQNFSQTTTLVFEPASETFVIHRPSFTEDNSSLWINSASEIATHTLFTSRNPATGVQTIETLNIRAWRDNSVLEVFVNGRTAISTRIYAGEESFGVRFFADDNLGGDGAEGVIVGGRKAHGTEMVQAELWDHIGVE